MAGGRTFRLDHVAVAVERLPDAWPRYVVELGGAWLAGGATVGFANAQLTYANGGKVELLEPHRVDEDDFLRRFLDRHGPGPHHLTFVTDDLEAALPSVEAAGYRPVGVHLDNPWWREAFLHPRQATGVVVQLASTDHPSWRTPPPSGFPRSQRPPASLLRVGHAVASLERALGLFADVLGGERTTSGGDADARWVELAWAAPVRLRLIEPASAETATGRWVGDRPGRVHHLAFSAPDVGSAHEVAPDAACGARLLVEPEQSAG